MSPTTSPAVPSAALPALRRYLDIDGRFLLLAAAIALWSLALWQLAVPVAAFLHEAERVRMKLPYHIEAVGGFPWWPVALVSLLLGMAAGPRLRWLRPVLLVGVPLAANVVIHLSLHFAQGLVAEVMLRNF